MPAVQPDPSDPTRSVPMDPPAPDPVVGATPPGGSTGGAPGPSPRDPFSAYERGSANTQHDQALAILEQFLQIMGWPSGVDEQGLEMQILQNGDYLSPEQAYNFLFKQISPELQKANPNAEFGMTYDTYITSVNAFKDAFLTLTGSSDIPSDVLRMAVDQQWTQAEMTEFLRNDKRYSDPSQLPWLQQGMTFKDVRNQFTSIYGKNPTDPRQLSSWFSFRQGAQSVGTGQVAAIGPLSAPAPTAAPPSSQVEVR